MTAAVFLRIFSAIYQGNTVAPLPGIYDQISYDTLARRVVNGHGFSFEEGHWPATPAGEPTAHWSYLYTLYLAAIYRIFSAEPLAARLVQAILAGILHTWLAWRIGTRIFGPNEGLIAAGLSAMYVYFFYYAGGLLTETFYIIGILWTMDASLRIAAGFNQTDMGSKLKGPKVLLWLELGLAIGTTVLLRQVFLFFIPFLFIWLCWNLSNPQHESSAMSGLRQRLLCKPALQGIFIISLVLTILITPWTLRNFKAFNAFVPLNTNAGFAFFWGNHPIYGTDYVSLLPPGSPSYYDLIPPELLSLNEANLDRALLKRGIGFVFEDPVRIIRLSLGRAREYFKFWPSRDSSMLSNLSRVGSFGIAIPFILYGLGVSIKLIKHPRKTDQPAAIILLYLFVVVYSLIHLVSWALIRYRLPVDAILLVFAALGLVDLIGCRVLWTKLSSKILLLNPDD